MKWEYKIIVLEYTYPPHGPEEEFNRLGQDGWELVQVKFESSRWTVILKRFIIENINKIHAIT